jgi:hypothetical protein
MYLSFLFYGGLAGKLPTDRGESLKTRPQILLLWSA